MRTALVISGGGRNGAFSAGAIYALRSNYNISFDVVSGTSTGALQAGPALLDDLELLNDVYTSVEADDILDERGLFIGFLKGALAGTDPLKKLIKAYVDTRRLARVYPRKIMIVNAVNLRTGKIARCTNWPKTIKKLPDYTLASASMPVYMDPVEIDGDKHVDGGIVDLMPTDAVKEHGKVDRVIMLYNDIPEVQPVGENPEGMIDVLSRTINIMLAEILRNDTHICEEMGVDAVHIYPERPLGDALDFDKKAMLDIWLYGYDRACEVMR